MKKIADTVFMNIIAAFFSPLGPALAAAVMMLIMNFFSPQPDSEWIGSVTAGIFALGVIIGLGLTVFEYVENRMTVWKKKKRSAKNRDKLLRTYREFEQAYNYFVAELALDREGTISHKQLTEENLKFIDDAKSTADAILVEIARRQIQGQEQKMWPAPKGTGSLVRFKIPAALEYINK